MSLHAGSARFDDTGESLVELLVSIAIFGIAVLAILGALTMSASSSSLHEGQAKAQNALRNWAEQISAAETADYDECATVAQILAKAPAPTGGTISDPILRWNTNTRQFVTSCSNSGLQRLTLNYAAPSSLGTFTQSLDVVIRRPCASLTGPGSC